MAPTSLMLNSECTWRKARSSGSFFNQNHFLNRKNGPPRSHTESRVTGSIQLASSVMGANWTSIPRTMLV